MPKINLPQSPVALNLNNTDGNVWGDTKTASPSTANSSVKNINKTAVGERDIVAATPQVPTYVSAGLVSGPPLEIKVALADPRIDIVAHASQNVSINKALAAGLIKVGENFPALQQSFLYRFTEVAAVTGALAHKFVYNHEIGHLRAAQQAGLEATIDMPTWTSGLTSYSNPKGLSVRNDQLLRMTTAGMNQSQFGADYAYQNWARTGSIDYVESMDYMMQQLDQLVYVAKTASMGVGNVPASNDVAAYLRGIQAGGHALKLNQLLAITAAVDLLSAPTWAALFGTGDFLFKGDRVVDMPTFEIGDLEATFPQLHTYLDTQGVIVGGSMLVSDAHTKRNSVRTKPQLEISIDSRLNGSGQALGLKLYDYVRAQNVKINPFVRMTRDTAAADGSGVGFLIGTDAEIRLDNGVTIGATVAYHKNDLLNGVQGGTGDGIDLRIQMGISF